MHDGGCGMRGAEKKKTSRPTGAVAVTRFPMRAR